MNIGKELKMEEILNLEYGTQIIYESEDVREIRTITKKTLYGKSAECNSGYYMPLSEDTQKRNKYRIFSII